MPVERPPIAEGARAAERATDPGTRPVLTGTELLSALAPRPPIPAATLGTPTFADLHASYAAELTREDELANQRTTWLLGIAAVLLAGYAGTIVELVKTYASPDGSGRVALAFVTIAIASTGTIISRALGLSIAASSDAWTIWQVRWVELAEMAIQRGYVDVRSLPWSDRAGRPWDHPEVQVSFFNPFRWGKAVVSRPSLSDPIDRKGGLAQRLMGPVVFWLWVLLSVAPVLIVVTGSVMGADVIRAIFLP